MSHVWTYQLVFAGFRRRLSNFLKWTPCDYPFRHGLRLARLDALFQWLTWRQQRCVLSHYSFCILIGGYCQTSDDAENIDDLLRFVRCFRVNIRGIANEMRQISMLRRKSIPGILTHAVSKSHLCSRSVAVYANLQTGHTEQKLQRCWHPKSWINFHCNQNALNFIFPVLHVARSVCCSYDFCKFRDVTVHAKLSFSWNTLLHCI